MKKKKRIIIITIAVLILTISSVYAGTLIASKDVIYDNSKSNGNSNNVQGALDELYAIASNNSCSISNEKLINENMISYVTNIAKTDTTNLAYDDTADKNLRYIGSNPNNYVLFNDELWRIIGVMNNVKDSSGTSASRIKLIRAESIGDYSFDNSGSDGISDYSKSRLMSTLNSGPYWNKTNGTCYNGAKGATTNCDFSDNGLNDTSKNMISSVVWNLGGNNNVNVPANKFYDYERSNSVYGSGATTWTGYVGLMYASDYGYAVGNEIRSTCLQTGLGSYSNNNCYIKDWLYYDTTQRAISPFTTYVDGTLVISRGSGNLNNSMSPSAYAVRPVVYLNTSILITKGEGTESNPYKLSFEKETPKGKDTSNASTPKLDNEGKLIPVTLANDGTVSYISEEDYNWYNYNEKKWANAVILTDSPSKRYKEGDIILESDIESYFVWIPKYKYKLWNTGTSSKNAHEIEIIFDTEDTTDVEGVSCKTPMTSGATGNCDNGEYMTHPAFISLGVDGFWVGKFETGYKGATSTSAAQVSSSDSSKIIIKPNVYSWRSNTIYNSFISSYNYERNLDSHMMKNTEWGAVAYLSHSKYGINKKININNNSSYKTGYSSLASIDQSSTPGIYGDSPSYNDAYNTSDGYLASTTGNITGVYDMSGSSSEFMASYISGNPRYSGFTTTTLSNYNAKYFDIYDSKSAISTYQYRILGDATGEMGQFKYYEDKDGYSRYHNSWYNEVSNFIEAAHSWFVRGGELNGGILVSQFYFSRADGSPYNFFGSRLVITG